MNNYEDYHRHLQKLADVNYSSAVLQWDQETYMPEDGAERRGQQLATLAGISHDLGVDEKFGQLLLMLKQEKLEDRQQRNIELSEKDYNDRKKYTAQFVEEMTRAISAAFVAWQEAKSKNDYSIYAPRLEKIVDFKKREAELLGYKDHPYDAMIDQYEPGTTTADVDLLFNDVREKLGPFVRQILALQAEDDSFMYKHFDQQKQWNFGMDLLRQMGYDFKSGRQDISSHPFTTSFSAKDVRVTTRVDENNLHEMIWSTIHEGGHALYEQGLRDADYGLPTGEACSLAIHESQSRLWENVVGRGVHYWKANYSLLQNYFPEQMGKVSLKSFYHAMNRVQPGLIRTNADELTYHFHILIRFEIEKALMSDQIKVKELPDYWNAKYKEYLNIDVPDNRQGVLQDIHWSHGSIGYFPTYSLGSFYAAQFYASAKTQIPGLENEIEQGNMQPLLKWLRTNIHDHGRYYPAPKLVEKVTGNQPDFTFFMNYAKEKYTGIYKLS